MIKQKTKDIMVADILFLDENNKLLLMMNGFTGKQVFVDKRSKASEVTLDSTFSHTFQDVINDGGIDFTQVPDEYFLKLKQCKKIVLKSISL